MDFLSGIISLIILIYSAILHEIAHGFVADRLGDPTARLAGRLSLNPKKHIDPFMSVLLPLLLIFSGSPVIFGAAKPVPIDPFNLKEGRKDIALVALSGPLTNIVIAVLGSFALKLLIFLPLEGSQFFYFSSFLLEHIITINLLLAIFNLLPIPPLDGSKVFALLLPAKQAPVFLSLGSIGFFIIFFLLLFPVGGFSLGSVIFTLVRFSAKLLGL